ncbi:MAG: CheB methylesterase domain-containing protein [Paracoccus sp. (in: a-proteobacteria)]
MRRYSAPGIVKVIGSATLGDTYRLLEAHVPQRIFIAAEFAELREFEALADMISLIGAELVIYGESRRALSLAGTMNVRRIDNIEDMLPPLGDSPELPALRKETPASIKPAPARSPAELRPVASYGRVEDLVCIGASTGGISALEAVLKVFQADCPPTLIVQHIRPGFAEGLIRRLNSTLAPQVTAGVDNQVLERGTIYLAASTDHHLGIFPGATPRIRLIEGDPVSGHRPSVDVLFCQAAALAGKMSVRAALLTGMGADGADGMCALREAGGLTIAQDRGSSVVWGMPRVAIERGGAVETLPLSRIGEALLKVDRPARRRAAWD